ncbi:MAG TPA: cytochrome c-type biogenesis protein [Moraxellaceae bacterium]|nr:cytochrome c-type biogenesis protein [Moraxellaceae bacterium]
MHRLLLLLALLLAGGSALATIDAYEFRTPAEEQRFRALVEELRCPKCQNTNLAGSDAAVAQDLKDRVYRLIQEGKTDAEIRQHLVDRYGDFITYKPPVRGGTLLLWAGPALLLLVVGAVLVWRVRRPAAAPAPLSDEEQRRLRQLLDDPDFKG